MILLASPTKTPQHCNADKILEAVQLLPLSYCVYTALLKRIAKKTPMLEVLLEALELLKAFGAFGGFGAEDARRFLGGIRMISC